MESQYNFTAVELKTMYERFVQIFDTDTQRMPYSTFCDQPEVAMCPIVAAFVEQQYSLKPDAPPGLSFTQ